MRKTILVTGGVGFIGSHTVNLLIKNGYKIEVVDNFKVSRNNVIKNDLVTYHEVDILDKENLKRVFKQTKPDAVIHFAALAVVPESVVIPAEYYETNIVGSFNLLECMRGAGVNSIVFSSSAATYGESKSEKIKEDHSQNPINPYGYTKLVFENMLKDYNRAYGLSSISLRFFCAAGCDYEAGLGEWHVPATRIIPSIVEAILGKRKEFHINGNDFSTPDGTGIRVYIHVCDLADAHVLAMQKLFNEENICAQYNLGINKGYSVMELIVAAETVSGKKLNYSIKERRLGDPAKLIADATKAQKELGWKPKFTDIKEIIESTYLFTKNKK